MSDLQTLYDDWRRVGGEHVVFEVYINLSPEVAGKLKAAYDLSPTPAPSTTPPETTT